MGENSHIEWCDHTWNPWIGCAMITAGCANCYMFTAMRRFRRHPDVVTRTKTWRDPPKWNRKSGRAHRLHLYLANRGGEPSLRSWVRPRIFTCSWSDFFIEESDPWRDEAWDVIHACRNLDFLVLTKRPERIADCMPADRFGISGNVWMGVSVENRQQGLPRIDILRETPVAVRFLSIEPLLEDLGNIDLSGISWVIVGGESGSKARPMHPDWARSVRDQCQKQSVPFHFKQWGQYAPYDQLPQSTLIELDASGAQLFTDDLPLQELKLGKKRCGRELDGRTWNQMPEIARST